MVPRLAFALPFSALALAGCISHAEYYRVVQENEQLKAEIASLQAEQRWIEAADMLFPPGGWQLTTEGKRQLDALVPRLRELKNAKVVVYGYTDDTPVGSELQRQGVANNLDLSSRRAGSVVSYLASQGVDPSIMSAKGRGETHPVAANDTPEGRARNRRIEIILEGPGATES